MMLNVQAVRDWGKLCGDHQNFPGLPSRLTSWDGGQLCRDHKNLPGLPTEMTSWDGGQLCEDLENFPGLFYGTDILRWGLGGYCNCAEIMKISLPGLPTGLTSWDGGPTVWRSSKFHWTTFRLTYWPAGMGVNCAKIIKISLGFRSDGLFTALPP